MHFDSLERSAERLALNFSLCNWFQFYSALVWEKISFAHLGKRLKINETTITQNLVFDFWQLAKKSSFPISIYESNDEKSNGNDLEFLLQTQKGYLLIPVQAKIIKKNNKYSTLKHVVRGRQQIDLLLDYASRKRGMAAYLFYNWCYEHGTIRIVETISGETIEHFGCSLASAKAIKKYFFPEIKDKVSQIPSFGDIHPDLAMPFHFLVGKPIEQWYPFAEDLNSDEHLHFYSVEELENDLGWEDIAPPARIGYITQPGKNTLNSVSHNDNFEVFNPKFRIVLSYERKKGGLYRIS